MEMMEWEFGYADEVDRSYGAAGMAIGVVVYKGADRLSSVDLDAESWCMVDFFDDLNVSGGRGLSVKGVWGEILGRFEVEMAMAISNVMCRRMVKDHSRVSASVRSALLEAVKADGAEVCALEADEVARLFEREYGYLCDVFNHSGVWRIADAFAGSLRERRRMSRMEVLDALRELR